MYQKGIAKVSLRVSLGTGENLEKRNNSKLGTKT